MDASLRQLDGCLNDRTAVLWRQPQDIKHDRVQFLLGWLGDAFCQREKRG